VGVGYYVVWSVTTGPAQVEYYLSPYPTITLGNGNNFIQGIEIQNLGDAAAIVNIILYASSGATVCNGNGACEFANVRIDQNTPWVGFSFTVHVPPNLPSFTVSLQVQKAGSLFDLGTTLGQLKLDGAAHFTYKLFSGNVYDLVL